MRNDKMTLSKLLRYLFLITIIAFGTISIISSGGGGGDDDGDGDGDGDGGGNVAAPQIYNFSLNMLAANQLTFNVPLYDYPVTIPVSEFTATGIYEINGQKMTLTGMEMDADFGEVDNELIDFRIVRIEDIKLSGTDFPTQGAWEVSIGGAPVLVVRVNSTIGGVDIDPTEGDVVSITWDQLMDIGDNSEASGDEFVAYLSYGSCEYSLKRFWYFFQSFTTVFSVMEELENAGSNNVGSTISCDPFPPTGGTAGTRQYKYIDASSNGELGPGDDFQIIFDSSPNGCWYDDPEDDVDLLVKGTIEMNGYIENIENDQMTSTGFDEVLFVDFMETETENNEVTTHSTTTNGGFNIFIMTEY